MVSASDRIFYQQPEELKDSKTYGSAKKGKTDYSNEIMGTHFNELEPGDEDEDFMDEPQFIQGVEIDEMILFESNDDDEKLISKNPFKGHPIELLNKFLDAMKE